MSTETVLKLRLHVHQDADKNRGDFYGGPLGEGYVEGPMEDIKTIVEESPNYFEFEYDTLENITWGKVDVMWGNGSYVHGITHITWKGR
jgi:hypothetical protein